jgi:hypothetical protein
MLTTEQEIPPLVNYCYGLQEMTRCPAEHFP